MATYLVLTSKPGQFNMPITAGLKAVEAYDYLFCGSLRARFVIVEMAEPVRISIIDEEPPYMASTVPSHLVEQHGSLEQARASLDSLVSFGKLDVQLKQVALEDAVLQKRPA